MPKQSTADFFNSYAHDFNAIYGRENTLGNRLINKIFRRSMRLRYQKTIEGCMPVGGKSVLDIGCGSGHYGIILAQRGIKTVWGIDFAPAMIELAKKNAARAGVDEVCRFIADDFSQYQFERIFDYTILMGYMDYVAEPGAVIARALSLTTCKAFFSFPAAEGILARQRRRRYKDKCDLYLYRREEVDRLFEGRDFGKIEIEKISRDYFVTVEMKK
jgi:2-polyprenyl-3-methyl-5-hydroxy-6-metoxy-1,4-benzoquinol methylase